MKANDDWYSYAEIKRKKCQYNVIFGKRSNGKTYGALLDVLVNFVKSGKQGAYVRRYADDFKGKRGQQVFDGLVANGVVSQLTDGKYDSVKYSTGRWFLANYNINTGKLEAAEKPFMFAFALTQMEHDKSTSYPDVTTIIFDEFLSRIGYLKDEFMLFMNVVSTIVRQRNDVTIYMLGNTVNKYCPYFTEMGLTHVDKMEPGTIDVYTYGESKLKVAVEYCKDHNIDGRKSDSYFAFDNPQLQMITNGVWEVALYPHIPRDYDLDNIVFRYFIIFNNQMLQCEVLVYDDCAFTYIHRKTGEIKHPDTDVIFSEKYDPRPNYFRNIKRPTSDIVRRIGSFFASEKVFYQDNEVGEIVRNYLQWCQQN